MMLAYILVVGLADRLWDGPNVELLYGNTAQGEVR